ncbi:unnamed protein product [Nezara viridula]|uniref:HMG box domain-containing protein n=1 Tax=Nezara viridula TaxID=85310 RepID=A0A9P0HDT7_NEZVI|nr:unnamed protein product [Nezara viridula]
MPLNKILCRAKTRRRPPPFFNLLQDLRKQFPDLSPVEIAKLGGKIWRELKPEEKAMYMKLEQRQAKTHRHR